MPVTSPPAPAAAPAPPMARIAGAAFAGTMIEFYDFFIFGTATALVFGHVFFAALGGARGTLALGATYAVAFLARPIGAVLLGHIGDRVGRRKTLIYTLLLMGSSTFAIGLIPSYDSIGVAAPIILVTLRFCQGLAVGGEWAGAALLAAEFAPPKRRGLYGMFPQLGPAIALALSSATFLVVFKITGDPTKNQNFQQWGWRIPFLASIVLVGVGLYIRLKIEETPVFRAAIEHAVPIKVPVRDAVAVQGPQILLVGGALTSLFGLFYIGTVFVTGYAGRNPKGVPPGTLGLAPTTILTTLIIAAAVSAGCCALSALYSDRWGRRRVLLVGNLLAIPVGLAAFPIMDIGGALPFAIGLALMLAVVGVGYGPAAAYLPEIFATRYRYSGAGLAYNLGGVLGGAVPILLAPQLLNTYNSFAIGLYLAALGALSTACVLALPETKDADIAAEPLIACARGGT